MEGFWCQNRSIICPEGTRLPSPKPKRLTLEEAFQQELEILIRRHSTPQQIVLRARIVLLASEGLANHAIARTLHISIDTARHWRNRWLKEQDIPLAERSVWARLSDAPRPGAPAKISAEAYCQIMALACQPPEHLGRPITHWTPRELAEEAIQQQIVESISPRQVGRFLKRCGPETALDPLLAHCGRRPGQRPKDPRGLSTL
jgi:putative transposase